MNYYSCMHQGTEVTRQTTTPKSGEFLWVELWLPNPQNMCWVIIPSTLSVQFSSQSCPTLCDPTDCSTPGFPVHHQLPELIQTQVHWVCDAIQPSHPLLSTSPPAFNHFQHQGLFKVSVLCIRWPKYWNFSFSISPSNEYSGLISFRIYWLDLLSVQGTLKSLLQHHTSKASILLRSAFFIVQLSVLHNVDLFGNTISPKLK